MTTMRSESSRHRRSEMGMARTSPYPPLKWSRPIAARRSIVAGAVAFVFLCTVGSAHGAVGRVLRPIRGAVNTRGLRAGQTTGYLASTERVDRYRLFACAANLCGMMMCIGDRALLPAALVAGGALDVGAVRTHTRMHMYRRAHARMLTHTHTHAVPCTHDVCERSPDAFLSVASGRKPAKTIW